MNSLLLTFLLLTLTLPTTSLHVFVSSNSPHLLTKQTFSLVVEGDDCPFNPCFYSLRLEGEQLASGQYVNDGTTPMSIDVVVSTPGEHRIMMVFSDDITESDLPYGLTAGGGLSLVFILPVHITQSDYCNSIKFSVAGKEVEGVLFSEETLLELDIFNGANEKITSQYFHSGFLTPIVELSNSTSHFSLLITRNYTSQTWVIPLNRSTLLIEQEHNIFSQQDWLIRVTFPNTFIDSCLVQPSVLPVSLLSSFFKNPEQYFGASVEPVFEADRTLQFRNSPCSRNVMILFQEKSKYFGLSIHGSVQWFTVPEVGGKSVSLLEVVLLPEGVILVTTRGIVTLSEEVRAVKLHTTTRAIVTTSLGCPASCSDRTIITLNQSTVLSAECPYSDWEVLPIKPDTNCKILDTYLDIIRNMTVVTQNCGDIVSVNGSGYGQPFQTKLTWKNKISGVHWDEITSHMYLYGSQILSSTSRGRSVTTVLTLEEGESIRNMVSSGLLGDVVAITESGRIFISNVGINRFVEMHNLHNSPISPHSYFTLDHTSQLCYHTLRNTSIARIPRRALYRSEFMSENELYLEPIGGNKVRLFSDSTTGTFTSGDVGKIFKLNKDRGSGRITEVSQRIISDRYFSVAVVQVVDPFVRPKLVHNQIFITENGDGSVTIEIIGGLWTSRQLRSCIVVLSCTPFLVAALHSPTALIASPLYAGRETGCMGLLESDRWFSINLDPHMSTVEVDIGDKFVVTEEVGEGVVTMSTPDTLHRDLVGGIVSVSGGRQGVVLAVGEQSVTFFSDQQFTLNEEFSSLEIVFSNVGSGTLAEGQYPREASWILSEPECEVVFLADDLSVLTHPVSQQSVYIDTKKESKLKVKVSDRRDFPAYPPVLKVEFENREKFNFYSTLNDTSHKSELTITLSHVNLVGGTYTPVLVTPSRTESLRCEVPSVLFSVKQECNPQTRLVLRYPHIHDQSAFLASHLAGPNGDTLMTSLPTNYRPPSVHGREISTSPNVYNVDPSQAVPRSVKAVSKNSYQFKQCAGAASKTDCSCSDKLRISDLAANSDCRENVYTVTYSTIFTPELLVTLFGEEPQPLNHTYLITEVNGREEYQIYQASQTVLSPNCNFTNCSIVFLGSELFHFRVTVVSDTICNYETEFLLFVVDAPLTKTLHNTITVHVGAIMFIIILIYYTNSKGADPEGGFKREKEKFNENSSSTSSISCSKDIPL
ncbi:hypothetical protein ACHWQZ_G008665 [Mnemiopsis leidyi]